MLLVGNCAPFPKTGSSAFPVLSTSHDTYISYRHLRSCAPCHLLPGTGLGVLPSSASESYTQTNHDMILPTTQRGPLQHCNPSHKSITVHPQVEPCPQVPGCRVSLGTLGFSTTVSVIAPLTVLFLFPSSVPSVVLPQR